MPNTRKNPRDPDSPFVTAEGMRKAVPFKERFPRMNTSSVTAVVDAPTSTRRRLAPASSRKESAVRLSPDVVAELQATGPGWIQLADDLLRAALKRRRAESKAVEA